MRVYRSVEEFRRIPNAVVTSGTFDGVHTGHQKILARLNDIAQHDGGESVVITYWPHPRLVLLPDDTSLKLLNTWQEKIELLAQAGIGHLLCIPFTADFASISSEAFIRNILVDQIGTRKLVIGYDHRFGRNREGSFAELKNNGPKYGFEVEEIPRFDIDQLAVSSTAIRRHLLAGEVEHAAELLGRPYTLSGRVVGGEQLGRQLGYPTANLDVAQAEEDQYARLKLIPADGIYAVRVKSNEDWYKGMLYIGNRPAVGGNTQRIEVNLFDFNGDLYGSVITLNLIARIRGDRHFNNLEDLKHQMDDDRRRTQAILPDSLT